MDTGRTTPRLPVSEGRKGVAKAGSAPTNRKQCNYSFPICSSEGFLKKAKEGDGCFSAIDSIRIAINFGILAAWGGAKFTIF